MVAILPGRPPQWLPSSQFRIYIWLPPAKTLELSEEIITPVKDDPSNGTRSFHPVLIPAAVTGAAKPMRRSAASARKIRFSGDM
jgi:hypothetical protein